MLHPARAGIQGWRGKPRRLPAEETLQFEKKNSSHLHRCFLAVCRRCKGGAQPKAATGVADCKLPLPVLWGYSAEAF